MAEKGSVVLLDLWVSPFAFRCRIALAEVGVEFESKEQNLVDKSQLLLEMNPVHKKIPVLIHDGKPVCESLVVVQYINEVWGQDKPILPKDPYARATARFWGDFVDNKIFGTGAGMGKLIMVNGEAPEEAKQEFIENLKKLEEELGDKDFFGGNTFGYVDIALVPIIVFFYSLETLCQLNFEAEVPKLVAWGKRCMERESVSKSCPDPVKTYEFVCLLKKRYGF